MAANEKSREIVPSLEEIDRTFLISSAREWMMDQVKRVAESIARRVKKAAEETDLDLTPLSDDDLRSANDSLPCRQDAGKPQLS